ncbi:His-Xaa-Ser system radical SAM maturase HxsC [Marinobacter sp.]|uniref:His-Xaa-Ser system radical SAM maturase HxsC n=1 Tax=Marinobacter sp. TaxID=50741 RepID=UPI003A8D4EDF
MRKVPVKTKGLDSRSIVRITLLEQLAKEWQADLQFLVCVTEYEEIDKFKTLLHAGLVNVVPLFCSNEHFEAWDGTAVLEMHEAFQEGDVVAISEGLNHAQVLIRETDQHHTVFLTNRCNSNCLMCSQPPTPQDDSWLVDEAAQVASHMRASPHLLGFTGGEPLLLGERMREVFDIFMRRHPTTVFDILTNGRLLADKSFAKKLLNSLNRPITWMVPLYGHADFLHDFIVQEHGAFEETLAGLLNLHAWNQAIQLRTVLIRPVLEILPTFCEFIGKNLPFVREVSLMACEPTGFALANPELSDIDLRDWQEVLTLSIKTLERAHVKVILMNAPLCALPPELWKNAHKSISDWKRKFEPECDNCVVKDECSGLFSWYSKEKQAMQVRRIEGVMHV